MGVISFQKIFGLYGLKGQIVEKMWDVTIVTDGRKCEDRATICEEGFAKTQPKCNSRYKLWHLRHVIQPTNQKTVTRQWQIHEEDWKHYPGANEETYDLWNVDFSSKQDFKPNNSFVTSLSLSYLQFESDDERAGQQAQKRREDESPNSWKQFVKS